MVIMEWKLDKNADTLIWLRLDDRTSTIVVHLDTDGMWKLPDDEIEQIFDGRDRFGHLNGRCANELFNSRLDITHTVLGKLIIAEWEKAGFPELEAPTPASKAMDIAWAPIEVLELYHTKGVPDLLARA